MFPFFKNIQESKSLRKSHEDYFFKIIQENKALRKSYEDYFIDKSKSLLNKRT